MAKKSKKVASREASVMKSTKKVKKVKQTKRGKKADAALEAMPAGLRRSKYGNLYYENR